MSVSVISYFSTDSICIFQVFFIFNNHFTYNFSIYRLKKNHQNRLIRFEREPKVIIVLANPDLPVSIPNLYEIS